MVPEALPTLFIGAPGMARSAVTGAVSVAGGGVIPPLLVVTRSGAKRQATPALLKRVHCDQRGRG